MKLPDWILILFFLGFVLKSAAQAPADPSLNNLVHTPCYQTSEWGSLPYQKSGSGKQTLLILPGWGFDGAVFRDFIENHLSEYTVYLLTLPGFGNTQAYPMPPSGESYNRQHWISGVMQGMLELMEEQKLQRPLLMGHFLVSSHIALRMAAEHGDRLAGVVVIGGAAEMKMPPPYDTLGFANRIKFTDQYLAPLWFKTVSRETWLNGNFSPETYSLDTVQAKQLWERANEAPLSVQIRYLCENWAADFAAYEQIKLPVLAVIPSFASNLLEKQRNSVLKPWYQDKWTELAARNKNIRTVPAEGTACNVMQDKPDVLKKLLVDFLNGL